MKERVAVTASLAVKYRGASRSEKGVIIDQLVDMTGWNRDYARKMLVKAGYGKSSKARTVPKPDNVNRRYDESLLPALITCWASLGMPCGKRLAPIMSELVPRLVRFGEITVTCEQEHLLMSMSAATIDRLLQKERAQQGFRKFSHTKPGSLLKSQIPVRTWAMWDENEPGFVEIDLVGHDGGSLRGEHCFTLTVTDIATGWTEIRSIKNKAHTWVIKALTEMEHDFPFPLKGIDSDNGSEFINHALIAWCEKKHITFTRSRPGNSNDGAHVEQKNWSIVRELFGYHRYDTHPELEVLNQLCKEQSLITNLFLPQQKLVSKTRIGAKVIKKYDTAQTPFQRLHNYPHHETLKYQINKQKYQEINPAAQQRKIQALTTKLLNLNTTKKRIQSIEATNT